MKKGILVLSTILLFGFAPKNYSTAKVSSETLAMSEITKKEIKTFNQIIESKWNKAVALENRALVLLEENQNSTEAIKLNQEAQMQRMMTLKYKAAIACRIRLLE